METTGATQMMTTTEVSKLFRVTPRTIRRWAGAGLLGRPVRVCKGMLLPRDVVEKLLRGEKA